MLRQLFNDWIDNHPWRLMTAGGTSGVLGMFNLDLVIKYISGLTALATLLLLCTTLYRKWFGKKKLNRTIIQDLLIIDDSNVDLMLFSRAFHDAGCKVIPAHTFPHGIEVLESKTRVDLILLDARGLGVSVDRMVQEIKTLRPDVGVVVTSGVIDTALMADVDKVGSPIMVLKKPNDGDFSGWARQLINDYKFGKPI